MKKRNPPPSAAKEPTCASCDNCSIHGLFCYLWRVATDLGCSCPQHTKLATIKAR